MIKRIRSYRRHTIFKFKGLKKILLVFLLVINTTTASGIIYNSILGLCESSKLREDKHIKTSTAPVISVNFPTNYTLYGKIAPNYSITITGSPGNYTWYEFLETGENSTAIELMGFLDEDVNGTFDQNLWDNLSNGTVTIRFYVNNSLGETGYTDCVIRIDIIDPLISITAPVVGVYDEAPAYDISITEANLYQYWYTLNGGSPIYITSESGTINSTAWGPLTNGPVEIIFYANDSLGNIGFNNVIITKDTVDPVIAITAPIVGVYDGAPSYDITVTEANLYQYWYTLNGGSPIYITSETGTINSTEWANQPDGLVEIIFYAEDDAGHIGSNSVTVTKDTVDPVIAITAPVVGVYDGAPSYDITVTEANLYQYWYTLNGGSPIYITSETGTINSTEWASQPDGLVEIIFYAEDDAGHIDSNSVTVTKDTVDPIVSITAPVVGVYDGTPSYDITVTEANLYQYWYTLNGGSPIYITSETGTINSTEWASQPEGTVEIFFYAEDDAGHIGSDGVSVTKDTVDPVIAITAPIVGVYDGAPSYDITITEANLYQYWYTLNGGSPIYITSESGTINSTEWGNQPEGTVEIFFYAEDDVGHIGSDSVSVTKDTVDPVIAITAPVVGVYDGAPSYDITITEANLYQYWYTLNGGSPIYITSETGTINSTEWASQPEGTVEIFFYAEDDAGHIGSDSVSVTKDTVDPVIAITAPVVGVYDGAPGYDITVTEANLYQYWYTLNGGSPIYITSESGTINSTEWASQPEGTVEIFFYAEDDAGHIGSNSVTVTKDTVDPVIAITAPVVGVYDGAPSYDITITEANLYQYWYTLNGGSPIYITSETGTINSTEWGNQPEGTVEIFFYAEDDAGHIGSNSVNVTKDTVDPIVSITAPVVGVYDAAPSYDITITEANLYQYWYTLNGGSPIYITSETGTINSTEWGNQPEGTVEIFFYAEDDVGHIGSNSVTITKDTVDPIVSITAPIVGVYDAAPSYDITVTEANLYQYWYTLNGGSPIYITSETGTINSTEWASQPDGLVEIIFYAEDDAGHIGSDSVTVIKDTVDPEIAITAPIVGVYDGAPSYDITITEANLFQYWYTLNGGSPIYITSETGTINSTEWASQPEGTVEIFFYAEDDAGHIGSNSVTVTKDTVDPVVSITVPVVGVYDGVPSYDITITEANLYQYWYTLNGGSPIYITSETGNINSTEWASQPDGLVEIIFYAEDDAGHIGSDSVTVTKDTVDPVIAITAPVVGVYDGPPSYDISITEANLFQYWYTLNGGPSIYIISETGTINSTEWDSQPDGLVEIIFYAEDDAGHIGSDSVTATKDTVDPVIAITAPVVGVYDGAPNYDITITEANLFQYWYTLNGGSPFYITSETGTINSTEWDNQPEGTVEIFFYAEDDAGHIGSDSMTVTKDTVDPVITITAPGIGAYEEAPVYDISISEVNLYRYWYTLNTGTSIYIISETGTINSTEWDSQPDGLVGIIFYAEDDAGNVGSNSVTVTKDTMDPILVFNTPVNNTYWNIRPRINITIFDLTKCFLFYSISGYTYPLDNNSEVQLEANRWNALDQGEFHILFSCYDELDHYVELSLTLYKDTMAPLLTINTPLNNTYWNSPPSFNLSAFDPNFDSIWYNVNNINVSISNNTLEEFNLSIWNSLPGEGDFQVHFYANDTFGHINDTFTLTLYKDILTPNLVINSPYNNTYWKLPPTIRATVIDSYLHTLWYRVGTTIVVLTNNTNQPLDTAIWDLLSIEGEFEIQFYANDSAGNLNDMYKLLLYKDVRSPSISINSPKPNGLYGDIAPNFFISIIEDNLDQTWYTLDDGITNYTFSGLSGLINQSAWDNFGNGTVSIMFYANDTLGNLGFRAITVRKNIFAPVINIVSPYDNDLFGVDAPNFTIYKSGVALNTTWYTLDGGLTNYTFYSLSGTIDQDAWDLFDFESVTIFFYINDSLGKIGFDEVTIRKDPDPPEITITYINPSGDGLYCAEEPSFHISVYEPNLLRIWYRVGETNITLPNDSDITLDSSIWDSLPQGKFVIEIFAEDMLGYINDPLNLTFYKDTLAPQLIINTPSDQAYYNSPPPINITVLDPNFNSLTYTVMGSTFWLENNTEELLDQGIWDSLPQGPFTVSISAFDSFGHPNNTFITIYKDTLAPIVEIILPEEKSYHNSPPIFRVISDDPNLHTIWYRIGTTSIELANNSEQILESSLWDSITDGIFTVEFYANDSFGYTSSAVNRTLNKDTITPFITINAPLNNTYYSDPPFMNILASDVNLDTIWYSVMGTKFILELGPEAFDQTMWDELDQGEFQVSIYANDSAGNLNNTYTLTILKDTLAPLITINSPLNNTYWNSRPVLNITAFDVNLDSIRYEFLPYLQYIPNNTEVLMNPFIWSLIPEGMFVLQIIAEDSLGNINNSITLALIKDTYVPEINISLPQPNELFGAVAPDFEISILEAHLNTTWYTLLGESQNFIFTGTIGTINQTEWDKFGNGTVTIRFNANDLAGNLGYSDITVRKNIFAPVITITSPGHDEIFGIDAPNFIIYKSGSDIQDTWYTLDNGLTNYTFSGLSGTINQAAWSDFGYESVTIRFYINDSIGKIGYDEVIINKDPDPPLIIVNSPLSQTYYASAPFINLTIIEPNLDEIWYIVNSRRIYITDNITQNLNSSIWMLLPQGAFLLEFYANDTLGNLNNLNMITLLKDTIGPNITIHLPTTNQKIDRNSPYFELTLFDENDIDSCWYTIIGTESSIQFTGTSGVRIYGKIDEILWQNVWDNLTRGSIITIRFYSMDSLGNINYQDITVVKYQPPSAIISNPIGFITSTAGVLTMIPITVKLTKSRYYEKLNKKEKSKLKKVIVAAFLTLSVTAIFFVF